MNPLFVIDEHVRVVRMIGWPEGTPNLAGSSGTVVAISPDSNGSGEWEVSVELEDIDDVWTFCEAELESIARPRRADRPLPPLIIRTSSVRAADEDSTGREMQEIGRLIGEARIESKLVPDQHGTGCVAEFSVWPNRDPVDAFEDLVEAGGAGWTRIFDDGWAADAYWRSVGDSDLLGDEVERVVISLRPWPTPRRRRLHFRQPNT
jgi:hypothetical protein